MASKLYLYRSKFNTFPFYANYDLQLQLLPQLVIASSCVNLNTETENHIFFYFFQMTRSVEKEKKMYLYFNQNRTCLVIGVLKNKSRRRPKKQDIIWLGEKIL